MKKTILNYLLISLIASSMPLQAESKAYYAKKTAKVAWHLSKMATASMLGVVLLKPMKLVKTCKESFEKGECTLYHTSDRIFFSSMALGSVVLLVDGCLGLNKELEIIDRIKRLYNKKTSVVQKTE